MVANRCQYQWGGGVGKYTYLTPGIPTPWIPDTYPHWYWHLVGPTKTGNYLTPSGIPTPPPIPAPLGYLSPLGYLPPWYLPLWDAYPPNTYLPWIPIPHGTPTPRDTYSLEGTWDQRYLFLPQKGPGGHTSPHPRPQWTEWLTDTCENIIFSQLQMSRKLLTSSIENNWLMHQL